MPECSALERLALDAIREGATIGRAVARASQLISVDAVLRDPVKRDAVERMRTLWKAAEDARKEWDSLWDSLQLPYEGTSIDPVYEYCTCKIQELSPDACVQLKP